jgi:hypothetical protein
LNFTGVLNDDRKIYQRIKQPKGRPQEIAFLGSFVLSEYAPGIDDIFDTNNEIDVFHSKEEMLEKIKFYLKNNERREIVADRGYEKVVNVYETSEVVKELLISLESVKNVKKTYYIDHSFACLFTSARFYYMVMSFLRGNFRSAINEIGAIIKYRHTSFRNLYYDIPRAFYHFFRS